MAEASSLTSLPTEIVLLLAERLHNIEDYAALSATCRSLRSMLASVTPNTILRLAAAQSTTFFRPSPDFLVAATARQLGDWARQSASNEATLATTFQGGMDALLALAVEHCGLSLARIRELYDMRFSIINPVADIIDQCVGVQWWSTPDFWSGGVDDAYTIDADPTSTLFHLAIYGELFAPDLAAYIDSTNTASSHRALTVETRLEFIKYCVPDFACEQYGHIQPWDAQSEGGTLDPRRDVKPVGPYVKGADGYYVANCKNNNIALVWVLNSIRWRPHWLEVRRKAADDFQDDFENTWWYEESDESDWRQRLWENVMVCQGLDGLAMIRPNLQDAWVDRIREWKAKIAALDREPTTIKVGKQATYDYPFLLGDLRICASGYVGGT